MTTGTTAAAVSKGSYLGDPKLKAALLREIKAHEKADQIVKGTYGTGVNGDWRGCAIGCALHSLNCIQGAQSPAQRTDMHVRFPSELGWPIELAYHIDSVFENLPMKQAKAWPYQVAKAIPVGVDLSSVMPDLLQWMILDPKDGWMRFAKAAEQQEIVQRFAGLVAQDWQGEVVADTTWEAIERELSSVSEWARAGAWARARAWAGARGRLRNRTRQAQPANAHAPSCEEEKR